jgi:hypothetical protein
MKEIICSICGKPAPHTHIGESYYSGDFKESEFEVGYKKGKSDEEKKYELSYDQIFAKGVAEENQRIRVEIADCGWLDVELTKKLLNLIQP